MLIRLLRLILIFILVSVVASFVRAVFQGLSGQAGGAGRGQRTGSRGQHRHGARGRSGNPFGGSSPRSVRKDALETLGLQEGASDREIRRAYRNLAQKYHPDRVAHLGPELVELTSEKFREIREAYEVLGGNP